MPTYEKLQEIAENLDQMSLGLDDTFRFKCYGCGKCCKNREDILLSPKDLFNIASALGKTTKDVVESICDCYIGGSSRIPIVRLQPVGKNMVCPLLKDNRCSVHALKPAVCALYPIGRFVKCDEQGKMADPSNMPDISYLLNPVQCGGHRNNTVRSWLESFDLDPYDPYYIRWTGFFMDVSNYIRGLESAQHKIPREGFAAIWSILDHLLYQNYDIAQEFMQQFEANITKAKELIDRLDSELIQPFMNEMQSQ
jgi:Fe-S-cluster containining protein